MHKVTIYCDGGAQPNPGEGGWAAILMSGSKKKALSGYSKHTTNNIMETTAVLEALRALTSPCEVDLYVDSKYVMYGLARIERGQLLKTNVDVWKQVALVAKGHKITVQHVKGHTGDVWNEFVDSLATNARRKKKGEVVILAN